MCVQRGVARSRARGGQGLLRGADDAKDGATTEQTTTTT